MSSFSVSLRRWQRPLVVMAVLALMVLGVLANLGSYREYRAAQAKIEAKQAEVAALEQRNAEYRQEVKNLKDGAYLEGLARAELKMAHPGEQLFIIQMPTTTEPTAPQETEPQSSSVLGRLLGFLGGLF